MTPLFAEKFPLLNLLQHALDQSYDAVSNEPWGPSFFGVLIYSGKQHTMIHYHENKVGVLDFANLQELGMCLKAQGPARAHGLWNFTNLWAFVKSTTPSLFSQ